MEFLEDLIEKDPNEAYPGVPDGADRVFITNDPLINKWEKEIHAGEEPDLLEALAPEDRKRVEARLARRRRKTEPVVESPNVEPVEDEFHDDYTKGTD